MKIFVHASRHHFNELPEGNRIIEKIIALASGDPIAVSPAVFPTLAPLLPDNARPIEPGAPIDAALALSIGGDGTFLHTAKWVGRSCIPILGINAGHLGYLADFTPAEFLDIDVNALRAEERMVLRVECSAPLPEGFVPYAVNEVALLKTDTASMISVNASLNSHPLTTYRADGLLVSTPTGSTGYNMSVGGPIIEPTVPAMVISPVAPHALTMRPLVVGARSEITMHAESRADLCLLSLDSRSAQIPSGATVKVSAADFPVIVVQRAGYHFAATLRTKLLWGKV